MKALHSITIILSLATTAALSAQTTEGEGPRGRRGGPGPHGRGGFSPIVRVVDADKDGVLSAAEIANAPAMIKTLDANNDGSVSAEELRPARPADAPTPPAGAPRRGGGERPASPIMLALDADKDGSLSAAEIANAGTSLKALDADKDGQLTRDELRPLPPTNE